MNKLNTTFMDKAILFVYRLEDGIIATLFTSMLGFAVLQIILRNFFNSGFVWSETLLRIGVLWLGLMGAMIASREGKHISIELMSRYLPANINKITRIICKTFTSMLCLIVAYYAVLFVIIEKELGELAFSIVPIWLCESIIPVSFFVISLRYILLIIIDIKKF